MFFPWKVTGVGYLVLNILRGLNVIGLLGAIAACVVMLIKTFIVNGFFFFDSITHVITMLFSIFLIISEVPLFERVRSWYRINFPLLSYESGVAPLGLFLIIDGALVLSNLNNSDVNRPDFGRPYYSTIIAGGLLPFISGILNFFASFIFANRKMKITSRMIRQFGSAKAQKVASDTNYSPDRSYAGTPDLERAMSQHSQAPMMANAGLGRPQTARSASVYSVTTNGRHITDPRMPPQAHYNTPF